MPIYNIQLSLNNKDFSTWDLSDDVLSTFDVIDNYENQINEKKLKSQYIWKMFS